MNFVEPTNDLVRPAKQFCQTFLLHQQNSFVKLKKRPNKKCLLAQQNYFVAATKFLLAKQNRFLSVFNFSKKKNIFRNFYPNEADKRSKLLSQPFPKVVEWYFNYKKSARFARTFSLRAARFARKFERAQGARFDRRASHSVLSEPRASRSVLCSSHTFKFISYNLILKLKPIL